MASASAALPHSSVRVLRLVLAVRTARAEYMRLVKELERAAIEARRAG